MTDSTPQREDDSLGAEVADILIELGLDTAKREAFVRDPVGFLHSQGVSARAVQTLASADQALLRRALMGLRGPR